MKVYLFLGRVMRADRGGQFTMVGRVLGFLHDLNGRVVSCDGVFSWHLAEKRSSTPVLHLLAFSLIFTPPTSHFNRHITGPLRAV
jgi:hypothetical protein